MKNLIKGNLCGMLCEESLENLSNIEVRLYLPMHKDRIEELDKVNAKETFHIVNDKEAKLREELLIAKTVTDEKGNYAFEIDEKYVQSAFDIDFVCHSLPDMPERKPKDTPVHCHITTIYPKWEINDNEVGSFTYNYCISHKFWCFIRGYYFDAWVICGYLRNCTSEIPITNATVEAWDADFLNDDLVGSATTNADGYFRIDYTSSDFKKTFLSPWVNVETDKGLPLTFKSGPDVYFKAFSGDIIYIDESSNDRRDNVSYCLCIELCTKTIITNPGEDDFPSAWTGIGNQFNVSFGSGSRDFDSDGYAGTQKFGLTGIINLTGQAPPKTSSNRVIEYRFLVSDTTAPNGGPALDSSNFDKIVGVEVGPNAAPGLFVKSTVAKLMEKADPSNIYDVNSDQSDFDNNGWFDVNSAVNRTLTTNGLGSIDDYYFIDFDTLITINTRKLTSQADVPVSLVNAGDIFPNVSKLEIEKFAIRFEVREVIDKSTNNFNIMPGSGKTLNSAVMNNNPSFMKVAIDKLLTLGDCSPISGTINALYTVHHPLLQHASIHVVNNNSTIDKVLNDGFLSVTNNTDQNVNAGNNNALQINDTPNDLVRCSYKLTLRVNRRLHTGNSQVSHEEKEIYFFYDV